MRMKQEELKANDIFLIINKINDIIDSCPKVPRLSNAVDSGEELKKN